jgi:hypothetical protein
MSRIALAAVMMASSLMACSPSSPPPLALPAGCNPLLAGGDCFLPYPSEVFLINDASFPSGKRIETSGAAKLLTKTGASADITDFMPADGFSRTPTIVAVLDSPIGDTGLTHIFDDPLASISASSRTLIVDAETGEAIPHLVDLDPPNEEGSRRALMLRPYVRLREMHRYVVVLRNLENEDGVVQTAPEGYRRLRDGVDVDNDPVLAPLAARYATDVFPVLQRAGVDRTTTQLVWDFSTGSDLHAMSDMLRMRELVLSELQRTPPTVTIFVTQENDANDTWRVVSGEITGPSVMTGDGGPGNVLARDDDGRVRLNGTVTFPFIGIVPASVRDATVPGATVLYGHGFFGGGGEMESSATRGILHEAHAVGFAIDWAGMSSADVGYVVQGVGEVVSESLLFGERVPQGMANWLALTEAITSGAVADAADGRGLRPFRRPTTVGEPGARATTTDAVVFDAASIDYLGISQGYILGTVMTALNPDVRRVAIQVGGGAFSHMMSRASPFRTYLTLLDFSMDNALEKQKLIASYQRGFDRFDPAQYGSYLLQEDLPFGPPSQREQKRCLMQIGIGDDQVPNFTSWNQARTVGVPLVTPSARAVPLLPTVAAPVEGSGLVIWDLGDDDSFYEIAAPATVKTSSHEGVRRRPEARAQLRRFFESGVIENTCGDTGCAFAPQ